MRRIGELLLFLAFIKCQEDLRIINPIIIEEGREDPTWSPDGKQIAYTKSPPLGIWIFDISSQEERFLVTGMHPDWSPDGKKIAFSTGRIHTINTDGDSSTIQLITDTLRTLFWPDWSPDGEKIAFAMVFAPGGLFICNSDGSHLRRIYDRGIRPDWSPNGENIAFQEFSTHRHYEEIWVINPDGTGLKPLLQKKGSYGWPAWSPDKKKIAFVNEPGVWPDQPDIWIMDSDGKNPHLIIKDAKDPAFSPDGKYLAFTKIILKENSDTLRWIVKELWIANSDGTDPRPLLRDD